MVSLPSRLSSGDVGRGISGLLRVFLSLSMRSVLVWTS